MSQVRTRAKKKEQLEEFKNDEPKEFRSHIVCVLDDAPSVKDNASAWVGARNELFRGLSEEDLPKDAPMPYRLMEASKSNQPLFKDINSDEVLYLYCHGLTGNQNAKLHESKIYMKDFSANSGNKKADYSAAMLLDFLIKQKLPSDHKVLKIAACYSDKFAKELSQLAKDIYPNMKVYGYKGELVVGKGYRGGNLAGFTPEGGMLAKLSGHYVLNSEAFYKDPGNFDRYKASNNRVGFLQGLPVSDEVEVSAKVQTSIKKSSASNEGASASAIGGTNQGRMDRGVILGLEARQLIRQNEATAPPSINSLSEALKRTTLNDKSNTKEGPSAAESQQSEGEEQPQANVPKFK
jgi:hypothetical protein